MAGVVAYAPDLMDRSRIAAAVPGVVFARTLADLADADSAAEVVVVDLSREGAIDAVASLGGRILGFASHVDHRTIESARAAGAEVFTRSEFFRRLGEILPPGASA